MMLLLPDGKRKKAVAEQTYFPAPFLNPGGFDFRAAASFCFSTTYNIPNTVTHTAANGGSRHDV